MITIAKQFTFDAAHRLTNLPPDHKCNRLHGHTYGVQLSLFGIPDGNGFIVDYQDIALAWEPIHSLLDHRYLNDIYGLEVPSTEVLVIWIFDRLMETKIAEKISAVKVSESSSTFAELRARDYAAHRRNPLVERLLLSPDIGVALTEEQIREACAGCLQCESNALMNLRGGYRSGTLKCLEYHRRGHRDA